MLTLTIGLLLIMLLVQFIFGFIFIPKTTKSRGWKIVIYAVPVFVLEFIILISMSNCWVDTVLNWVYDMGGGAPLDTLSIVIPVGMIIACWLLFIDKVGKLLIAHGKGMLKACVIMLIQGVLSAVIMFVISAISMV